MIHRRHHILVTRKLSDEDIRLAGKIGLDLQIDPVLDFEFINIKSEFLKLLNTKIIDALVFTSRNGVLGFQKLFADIPVDVKKLRVFAVGKKTAGQLQKIDLKAIIPDESNARGLARLITEDGEVKSVIHICGNKRRNELSQMVTEAGKKVYELIVYKTLRNPDISISHEMNAEAILFYSPGAVEAFLDNHDNGVLDMPVFAIGSTTAEAMQNSGFRHIFIADETSTESLLKKVKDFFNGML